jgi:hypothetical protein
MQRNRHGYVMLKIMERNMKEINKNLKEQKFSEAFVKIGFMWRLKFKTTGL